MLRVNHVVLTCALTVTSVLFPGPAAPAAPAVKDTLTARLRELQ